MRASLARAASICALALVGCTRADAAAVPTDAQIAAMPPGELEARFQAIEGRLRRAGLGPEATEERARGGHAALVAYRRSHDPGLLRYARAFLSAAAADWTSHAASCRASIDLASLARDVGARDEAIRRVEGTLREATGEVRCRDALRGLASELGVATTATVAGTSGHRGKVTRIDVLGELAADAAGIRVVVALDTDARAEMIPVAPNDRRPRARLRIDSVTFDASVALPRAVAVGGLARIERATGDSGVDLVLEPGATVRAAVLENPYRWVLDVDRGDATRERSGPPRVIVLDPGHGGDEHGARVDGTRESRLVLDIAKRAAVALGTLLPTTRVVMTRTTDDEVSLEQRSALANSLDADLFVSIHLNDAEGPVLTGGITTFVLDTDDERQALRLAARDNETTTDRVSGLSVLLAGLHRTSQVGESRRLASFVHTATLARARQTLPRLPDRGVRPAGYYVLVGTRMPSILVECSFMTRPEELTALRTAAYRQSLGEGIARGIAQYAASR